ncbi:MAG: DUF924 domain-containing protein [Alcaligenaceae bacterium]|jgi:uncharacterized protein (DUF924 family)|nr:DUF924 domain-containing protein [Alcaligenaceae bacterium]
MIHPEAKAVLDFWLDEKTSPFWFEVSADFDEALKTHFGDTLKQAAQGELYEWRHTALGRVAEIIVLDQFSRNIYRGTPQAFQQDAMALVLAQSLVALPEEYGSLPQALQKWGIMPYMHSESALIHEGAMRLFTELGDQGSLKFEIMHRDIIERFGRYPHRNEVLGRQSTAEELAFLQEPNSSF